MKTTTKVSLVSWHTFDILCIRHRNETRVACIFRACATCRKSQPFGCLQRPAQRRRRQGGRRSWGTSRRRPPSRRHHDKKRIPVSRRCAKSLSGQERPVDCGDTRPSFRHRGLARARATPRELIRGTGSCGRGGSALRRRSRARRLSAEAERTAKQKRNKKVSCADYYRYTCIPRGARIYKY